LGGAFNPSFWQRGERRLLFQATPDPQRSFGFVARTLIEGLDRRGLDVVVGPFRDRAMPGYERFWRPLWGEGHLGFIIDYLVGPSALGCERVVHYATFESTIVPRELVQEVNQHVTLLLVPCKWNLKLYRDRGVTVPIRLLPHGIHPERFPLLERPMRETFTIGTFGDLSIRKGIDVLIRAFFAEFGPEEPVRLLVKQTYGDEHHRVEWPVEPDNRRFVVRTGFLDQEALLGFLGEMDLFVLPSRGEGFGLCGLEAMATGLPTIATNWSGMADYLDPDDSFPLNYRLVDADGAYVSHTRYFGQWAEPDERHLRQLMRWAFEHRSDVSAMGRRASERVHRDWTWSRVIDRLETMLDAVAHGATPVE
jgi:glycosyltransferase involved in cell wall biosynthesis